MDIGVLYELHSVVEGECANGGTDELLVGRIGLVGEKDSIVVLTHSVVFRRLSLFSIFLTFLRGFKAQRTDLFLTYFFLKSTKKFSLNPDSFYKTNHSLP